MLQKFKCKFYKMVIRLIFLGEVVLISQEYLCSENEDASRWIEK